MKIVCANCGSDKIQILYWVEHNTQKIIDASSEESDSWCPNCEDHVQHINENEFKKK